MIEFIKELWQFMRQNKKYWLVPILLALAIFGGLIAITRGPSVAPVRYTLF